MVLELAERAPEPLADGFDLFGFDHQWGTNTQPVSDHAQTEGALLGRRIDARADVERSVEGKAPFAVAHQPHAEDETNPAHVADERMRFELAERRLQQRPEALGARNDVDLRIDLLHLERDGGSHRMSRIGEAVREIAELVRLADHRLLAPLPHYT